MIICGSIRERQSHIERLKEQLNNIAKNVADYAIVENDSKDNTRQEFIFVSFLSLFFSKMIPLHI
jgi:hypothetical protein